MDLVIDPVSLEQDRPAFVFENQNHLLIDTIENITSNKMCAVVSRTEPKDFVDFYLLGQDKNFCLDKVYQQSRMKDAIFDDPPTVAFQLECGISFMKENLTLLPNVTGLALSDFFGFYEKVANWLYGRVRE